MRNNYEVATRYLFVTMAIKNLELDLQHVLNGPFKIKDPYLEGIEKNISKAIYERRKLKSIMYKHNIQILFLYKKGDFSTYKFISNNEVQEKTFMNQVIKKNVEVVMSELMG